MEEESALDLMRRAFALVDSEMPDYETFGDNDGDAGNGGFLSDDRTRQRNSTRTAAVPVAAGAPTTASVDSSITASVQNKRSHEKPWKSIFDFTEAIETSVEDGKAKWRCCYCNSPGNAPGCDRNSSVRPTAPETSSAR